MKEDIRMMESSNKRNKEQVENYYNKIMNKNNKNA